MRPLLAGAALACLPAPAAAVIYYAHSIEGWVLDARSGKPIEGVVVVAHWQLRAGSLGGGGPAIRELQISEAVTDEKGRYYFPSWGPRFALRGNLESRSPELLYFKSGYRARGLANEWHRGMDTTRSEWHGKTVKLEPFDGSPAEYAEHLSSLSATLWIVGFAVGEHSGDYCGWKSFPRILSALDRVESDFRAAGVVQGTVVSSLRSNDGILKAKRCGSVTEVLGARPK
jgi:hypothetical protein